VLSLHGDGDAVLLGSLNQNSDARLKKNIIPLQNSLEQILQLNGYTYQWIDSTRNQSIQYGVLAQEIEKYYPELVSTDDKGLKSVNYAGLLPLLLQSIQELDALQHAQRLSLEENNNLIRLFEKEVEQLEAMVVGITPHSK
jgi:hypothetical protein